MPATDRELRGMMIMVDEFCADMRARLANRERAGHTGWHEPSRLDQLLNSVVDAARRIPNSKDPAEQALDTANYAFFLWYHYRHVSKAPRDEGNDHD